jgi:hypothetical protein
MTTSVTAGRSLAPYGAAGLVMVAAVIVLGPVMGGPDVFSSHAVADYARSLAGSGHLSRAPYQFGGEALLTAAELAFFAGVWSLVRRLAPNTGLALVIALAGAAFVAGGMASDAFSYGQLIALHVANGVKPDPQLAVISDISSTLLLIEVNICLGTAIATVCLAGLRSGGLPKAFCWYGLIAAAAALITGFVPTAEPVFIIGNLSRLVFIAILSVLLIRGVGAADRR